MRFTLLEMAKLVFIVLCGAGLILLIAYAANAEFNVVQGRQISDAQQEGIAVVVLIAFLVGCAVKGWLDSRDRQGRSGMWRDFWR